MDYDKLNVSIQKLQKMMDECDPMSEKFGILLGLFTKLVKLKAENDDACDKQNERQDKLDLDRQRLEKEFELKMKELELKYGIEEKKIEKDSTEAANRRRAERRQAIWDIIKLLAQILGSAALIAFTGKIEQGVIIGQHKWSVIPRFKA